MYLACTVFYTLTGLPRNKTMLPRIFLFALLALAGTRGWAQQQYYLYIQSTASQPFYARMQSGIYSSSENGYMIVSKLRDSTYDIFIGFARNAYPEQHFSVQINKQDQGFELRNQGEKGWGLFNLQNGVVVQANSPTQKSEADNTGERKSDPFSQMLANVVNDSSILYMASKPVSAQPARKPPVVQESVEAAPDSALVAISAQPQTPLPAEKKPIFPDSTATVKAAKKDSISLVEKQVAANTPPPVQTQPEETPKKRETPEKPFITRITETKTAEGYKAVFLEQYILSTDTVDVEIPLKELTPVIQQSQPPVTAQQVPDTAVISKPAPVPAPDAAVKTDTATKKKTVVQVTNSDCKNFASDNDVDKMRVKLLAENAIDDKLVVARKYFKAKCYSVKQIKALTELFPGDESKYRFFDTAYPFVSDTENFLSLEELIETDYYKNRFRAMIRR